MIIRLDVLPLFSSDLFFTPKRQEVTGKRTSVYSSVIHFFCSLNMVSKSVFKFLKAVYNDLLISIENDFQEVRLAYESDINLILLPVCMMFASFKIDQRRRNLDHLSW